MADGARGPDASDTHDRPRDASLAAHDSAARDAALDVSRSFLVQAPAGSGKTELLIQRFLALLATVERPESIVAMTFTRKAAGEMRERIVAALADATSGRPVSGAHARRTRALAEAALARDRARGWHLVEHPARLRLVTIDALATGLACAAPLASQTGGLPAFIENAHALYHAAASDALADAPANDPAWRTLLDHLDNDGGRAVGLLANMLGRRDQWLRHLVGLDEQGLRATMEATLESEIEAHLEALQAAFPVALLSRLASLARHAASHFTGDPMHALRAHALERCADAGGVPGTGHECAADWIALADWMLTGDGEWRRKIDKGQGFPPKGHGPMAAERAARKQAMEELLHHLAAAPGLREALQRVRDLPPARYRDASWDVIRALLALLPRVAASLKVRFAAERKVDFVEATQRALQALGAPNAPSDVLLALDQRIAHLLIDEFQDTSLVQHDLVLRLTAGWEEGDGRTLFAVGDPMQSIYRFREADVSLFLEAWQDRRLGEIALKPITLSRNFRSQGRLVDWVNAVFPDVLAGEDDVNRSAVAYKPSVATHAALAGKPVTLDVAHDQPTEAAHVVARTRAALKAGDDDVAILVRARKDLADILPALRGAGIAFQAVELDRLTERPPVLDLLALTHALTQPADRLAWLAVLRAPWCGLTLADLAVVAAVPDGPWPAMLEAATLARLADDGRRRLERVARILAPAIAARGRMPLALAVRGAWLALGGPATLTEAADHEAAQRLLELLAEHARGDEVADWTAFLQAVEALHAKPDPGEHGRVQVMTLHKAKGLEFGTVILAGLGHGSRGQDQRLLRWRWRSNGLILAPMRARAEPQSDPVYAYLAELDKDETAAELGRLLYVGTTRARHRLHLTASLAPDPETSGWRAPSSGSLLALLWPAVEHLAAPPDLVAHAPRRDASHGPRRLMRLPATWTLPAPPVVLAVPPERAAAPDEVLAFDWAREAARHVGTVAHRALARFAGEGLVAWSDDRIATLRPRLRAELEAAGVDAPELDAATLEVEDVLRGTLADTRGRWLFDPAHAEAASEWAVAGLDGGAVVHVTLDRTFVCDGERWIVDFKTGSHEGTALDGFLDREQQRYAPQLARYARLVRALDARPIRLALYYPRSGGWRTWRHEDPPAPAPGLPTPVATDG